MPTNDLLVIDIIYLVTKGCLEGSGEREGGKFHKFYKFYQTITEKQRR